jgi:hypothetical protein
VGKQHKKKPPTVSEEHNSPLNSADGFLLAGALRWGFASSIWFGIVFLGGKSLYNHTDVVLSQLARHVGAGSYPLRFP